MRHLPSIDSDSVTISKLRRLFADIVPCGPCVTTSLHLFSCTSLTHSSNVELILLRDATVSSIVWSSPGTPLRWIPVILHSTSIISRNLHKEVVEVTIFTASMAVSCTKIVLPSMHKDVGWEKEAAR